VILYVVHDELVFREMGDDGGDDCSDGDMICDGSAGNCDACSNGDKDDDYDVSEHEDWQMT
jgi:hypothetical protein